MGVGVAVADVGVGVGVGVGDDVDDDGAGSAGAEVVAVREGDGFALVGEADGTAVVGWPAGAGAVAVGDGLAGATALAVAPEVPAALVLPDPPLARAAFGECAGCEPPSARAVMIPVETMAITMAAAAAIREKARSRRRGCLTASGKPLGPNGPARSVTSCRYASVCWLSSAHSLSTSSRSPSGSAASGAMPNNAAGRSAPRLRSSQTSH